MSDLNPSAAPVARPRPSTVTIAGYLLYLVAGLQVVQLVLSLSVLDTFNDVFDEAYAGTDMADAGAAFGSASLIGGAVVGLVVAAGLVVLALLNNRGKNPARIVTWVLGGLFFCCSIAGLGLTAAGSALAPSSTDANTPDQAEIQRLLDERLPGWYNPLTLTLSVITVLALLAALVLLALPPSNEFFRKPQPVWEPPVPGAAYPAYPQAGYPQAGYPQSGPPQQYGPPTYPTPGDPAQQYGPPSGESAPPSSTPDDEPGSSAPPRSGPPTS
ncbi:hypothetical protein BDK92_3450 [Micromonospora pisi]|uniref:Uncharacterized protein n=1 Tax=Micromonospora pisi TaxID=589240 RepID=A0A495JJK8_9ACTN|nr:hypothetical protein [Micromonospora pisi]RKR89113.1 hypothetical protein BDK92_3450 [Micromonospora pisi]